VTQAPHSSAHSATKTSGTLYVVATPIGNLDDLSARALATLNSVDLIAAEDTRHTGKLLQLIGCATPMLSLHEHNERQRSLELRERLSAGANIALVSDAGTPLISDPGFTLVRELTQHGIRVVPVPGACAAIAALSVAGLPTDRFVFEGFLPAKSSKRRERLAELLHEARTVVFYEAPHRCAETLTDLAQVLGGERQAAACRELTKLYETSYYGSLAELSARAATDADMARGELVLVVAGSEPGDTARQSLQAEQVLMVLLQELPASQAAKLAARICGADRAAMYELAVKHKSASGEQT
jgi:16S rRNA (cytidine1402-2'-O)-methyltransferase